MERKFSSLVCGVWVIGLAILMSSSSVNLFAQNSTLNERPLAIVRKFKPDLQIKNLGLWKDAQLAQPLFNGDTLRTLETGFAVIQFLDNSFVKVKPNSTLVLRGEVIGKDNTATRLAVAVGEIFLNVAKQKSDFEVGTPQAVAAVKGTQFNTDVKTSGESQFLVFEGIVQVTANKSGKSVTLKRRQMANVDAKGNTINTQRVSNRDLVKKNSSYDNAQQQEELKSIKLRFIDADGQVRVIELKYSDLENDD